MYMIRRTREHKNYWNFNEKMLAKAWELIYNNMACAKNACRDFTGGPL